MISSRTLPALFAALSSAWSASAVTWKFDSKRGTCRGDPFANVYLTATCSAEVPCDGLTCKNYYECGWEDAPDFTGPLTATSSFSNGQVVVAPCLAGICPTENARVEGRVCDWITPVDGQSCGEAGNYMFDYSMQLPSEDSVPSGTGWMFDALTIKIQVQGEAGCETFWNYDTMGAGLVAGVALALCRSRRRGSQSDEISEYNEDDEDQSYLEMGSATSDETARSSPLPTVHRRDLPPDSFSNLSQGSAGDSEAAWMRSNKPPRLPRNCDGNLSPECVSQIPAISSRSPAATATGRTPVPRNSPLPKKEIPLEVLRQWYGSHGIAIV